MVAAVTMENHPRYTMGNNRGDPVFRVQLRPSESAVAAIRAKQDAQWQQQVEASLKAQGWSAFGNLQKQVDDTRKALAGSDADWKAFVDKEQERLGYTKSADAAEFRMLSEAIAGGGATWAAYVAGQGGPFPPATGEVEPAGPETTAPDLRGTWSSNFKTMTVRQEGNRVWGTYAWQQGQFAGTIEGDTVYLLWWENTAPGTPFDKALPGERGAAYLKSVDGGKRLVGRFRYAGDFGSNKEPPEKQAWACTRQGPLPAGDTYRQPAFAVPTGAFDWR